MALTPDNANGYSNAGGALLALGRANEAGDPEQRPEQPEDYHQEGRHRAEVDNETLGVHPGKPIRFVNSLDCDALVLFTDNPWLQGPGGVPVSWIPINAQSSAGPFWANGKSGDPRKVLYCVFFDVESAFPPIGKRCGQSAFRAAAQNPEIIIV